MTFEGVIRKRSPEGDDPHHKTLYKPLAKELDPVPDPSQNLSHVKLLGFSYSSSIWMPFTPRYKMPDTGIRARTRSLKAPRMFCKRRPILRKVPCTRHTEVRPLKAISRVLIHVGSIDKEWSRSGKWINSHTRIKEIKTCTFTENDATWCRIYLLEWLDEYCSEIITSNWLASMIL